MLEIAGVSYMHILVINCGSATLKYRLFRAGGTALDSIEGGVIETTAGHGEEIERMLRSLPRPPDLIAHRVVHGGDGFGELARVDDALLRKLEALAAAAPLHSGPAIDGIRACSRLGVPQVAAFDSAFHHTMRPEARRYALPPLPGAQRYGFHGWSHRYVTERYAELAGSPAPTIVSLHLGGGCSAAAIARGRSVDTSMGFTPLEGLVMATRPGDVDPGLILHLLRGGMTAERLDHMLAYESGLTGIAGTGDLRELLRRSDPDARLAVDVFCHRLLKYVGAYLAVLEGAEALVFTGGIGENSAEIRERICGRLGWLGLELDREANLGRDDRRISRAGSRLHAYVIRTDEERLIARETSLRFAAA
jgi:acetate kinase